MIIYYSLSFGGGRGESHELLRRAVSEYLQDDERAGALTDSLRTGRKGKPYIDGFSEFSISHSGNAWAVLFSDKKCGLDIQFERKCDIIAIARRAFDPADAELIYSLYKGSPEEARRLFFRIWTRREALTKALGESVFDSDIPSVAADSVSMGGSDYLIRDIVIPAAPELYASVCTEGSSGAGEIIFESLPQRHRRASAP